jgi:hypothetical protein
VLNHHPCAAAAAVVNNPLTANFQRLLLHTLDMLAAAEGGGTSMSAADLLHILTLLIKCVAAVASPAALEGLFLVPASWPQAAQGGVCLQQQQQQHHHHAHCQQQRRP